jgi:hypothetical protein
LDLLRKGEHKVSALNHAVKYTLAVRSFWESDRTFFRTKRGLLGIVTNKALPGDRICIFHGAPAPYVLRSASEDTASGQSFLLVAECYIHGLMNGEGLVLGKTEMIRLV